jgi:hypothetical protein
MCTKQLTDETVELQADNEPANGDWITASDVTNELASLFWDDDKVKCIATIMVWLRHQL